MSKAQPIRISKDYWSSNRLVNASVCCCIALLALSIFGTGISELSNGPLFLLLSLLVLKEAAKKRLQENEARFALKTDHESAYEHLVSNQDIYFTLLLNIGGGAVLLGQLGAVSAALVLVAIIVLLLIARFAIAFGTSMLPNMTYGDLLLEERRFLIRRRIKRKDIITIAYPQGLKVDLPKRIFRSKSLMGISLVKRVIAMPGETIRVTNGKVYINDQVLEEDSKIIPANYEINVLGDLGNQKYHPYSNPEYFSKPIRVPDNHYFVLGDLRINENFDSHIFGFVPEKHILGRIIAIIPTSKLRAKISSNKALTVARCVSEAKKLIEEHKYQLAIDECSKALALNENNAPAFAYRAQAKEGLGQYEEAIADCNQSIKLYEKEKDQQSIAFPYSLRYIAYKFSKRYDEALHDCNKVIELKNDSEIGYLNRANLLLEMNRCEGALSDCNKLIELNPKSPQAYNMRVSIGIQLQQYEKALNDANKVIEMVPNNANGFCNRAVVYACLKKHEEGLKDCDRAQSIDEKLWEIYLARSIIYSHLDRYQEAYDQCMRAKEIKPGCAIESRLGSVCVFLKKWKEALVNLDKVISEGNANAADFSNRALAQLELGDYDKSFQDCEKAIELNPKLGPAFKNRARIYLNTNKPELASADINKAIELDSTRGDFYYYRSQAYKSLGDETLAEKDLNKANELGYVAK